MASAPLVGAQTLQLLASFDGTNGKWLGAPLTLGNDGIFYGVAYTGGTTNATRPSGLGTVFKVTTSGTLTRLVAFNGNNGRGPVGLTLGNDSNFYGTTDQGGSSDYGTAFKVTPSGALTTLVNFNGTNGKNPGAGLALGTDGNFYGTTGNGGSSGWGTVFKMTPSGTLTTLASFNGNNGKYPNGLTLGNDGNFYGTTGNGGSSDRGAVFSFLVAPVVTAQPQSQTKGVGATVTFLASASGLNPLAYRWQKNGVNLVNGGNVSGATTSTLTITSISHSDAASYSLVVSNSFASVSSSNAVLTVMTFPPSIVVPPASQPAVMGTNVTLNVTATGSPLFYQWFKNGVAIANGTQAALAFNPVALGDAGNFSVVVSNSAGAVTSSNAVLAVRLPGAPILRVDDQLAVGSVTKVFPATASVTMEGGYANGIIYYTLNGSAPTFGSAVYGAPIIVSNTAIVRALGLNVDTFETAEAPAVAVNILPTYALTSTTIGSGTVAMVPSPGPYASNAVVSLTATANSGWLFDHWSGDASGSANPLGVTMDRPKQVQAVFVQLFPVSATTLGGGSVTITPAQASYPSNQVVSISATASNGWTFLRWSGDTSGTSNPLILTVNAPKTLAAVFGTTVGTGVIGSGVIELNTANPIPYGTVVRATAIPSSGSYFTQWGSALTGTNSPAEFAVVTTNSVRAVFGALQAGQAALSLRIVGAGSVGVAPRQQFYTIGDTVTLTATPLGATNQFISWTGDAVSAANPLVLSLNTSKVVTANFSLALTDVILDNTNAEVTFGGTWTVSKTIAGYFGEDYRYAISVAGGGSNVTYRPNISVPGLYDIYVWFPELENRATNAPWTVVFDGGSISRLVNQQNNGGGWLLIAGRLPFAEGTNGYVRLSNDAGPSVVIADAVRFLRVGPQDPFTNGLVAYYPFNGNAIDESGMGNNGVFHGTDWRFSADRFGRANSLYLNTTSTPTWDLDGAYVTAPRNAVLDFNADFTLSVWINLESGMPTNFSFFPQSLISNGSDATNVNLRVLSSFVDAGGQDALQCVWQNASGHIEDVVAWLAPVRETWWQITVVRSGSNLGLFKNGALLANDVITTPVQNGAEIWFGRYLTSTYPLIGGIDDVRMYNRALSSNEVAQLYSSESSPVLGITRQGGNVQLSWPVAYSSYTLLSSTELTGGAWITNTSPQTISGSNIFVTLPATNSRMFYRLRLE